MDEQDLATVQRIDHEVRALRYERDRLAPMSGMARNIETIDQRIRQLEKRRDGIVWVSPQARALGIAE